MIAGWKTCYMKDFKLSGRLVGKHYALKDCGFLTE